MATVRHLTTGHQAARPHVDTSAIEAQLAAMFSEDEGWIEAWHGHTRLDAAGKPTGTIDLDQDQGIGRRWHWLTPDTRPALARFLHEWGKQYSNVYISTSLYKWSRRDRQCALPSRVLFVDDVPAQTPLPPTLTLETSAQRQQGMYLLAEPVDTATRQDLQRRIAYALGADKSGHDIEQLCRVAGTFNTKHGQRHPVTLSTISGRRYSIQDIEVCYPPVATVAPADIGTLATADIEYWLGNIEQLLGADGIPRRLVNPKGQARRVLAGELHMHNKDGELSTSDDRACVCRGLVMHGYPDAEIAALLLHFCDYGASQRKGSAWLLKDIKNLIAYERERQPNVTPSPSLLVGTKASKPLPSITRPSRARKDRPHTLDAAGLLALYSANVSSDGVLRWCRAQAAMAANISIPTLDRLERTLRTDGSLTRAGRGRGGSVIVLFNAINIIPPSPAVTPLEASDDAEPVDIPSHDDEIFSTHHNASNVASHAHARKREHTAPIAPPSAQPEPTIDDADLSDRWAWEQELAIELPKRKRVKRPRLDTLPIAEQIAELKRRRGALQGKKLQAKWIGHDSMYHALERQAGDLRVRIEHLEREHAAALSVSPPPAQTLTLFDATAPIVDPAPEVAQCLTPAQDAPGEPAVLETPCSPEHAMQSATDAPSAADGLNTPWMAEDPVDAAKIEHIEPEQPMSAGPMDASKVEHIQVKHQILGGPLGGVCSPLPERVPVSVAMAPEPGQKAVFIPAGGWTPEAIAALPGVARGSIAADDPWIVLQRELAVRASARAVQV